MASRGWAESAGDVVTIFTCFKKPLSTLSYQLFVILLLHWVCVSSSFSKSAACGLRNTHWRIWPPIIGQLDVASPMHMDNNDSITSTQANLSCRNSCISRLPWYWQELPRGKHLSQLILLSVLKPQFLRRCHPFSAMLQNRVLWLAFVSPSAPTLAVSVRC